MRSAQRAMAAFMPLIDWTSFARRNWNTEASARGCHVFACGDERQAVVWLLRDRALGPDGRMRADLKPAPVDIDLPAMSGPVRLVEFDTLRGEVVGEHTAEDRADGIHLTTTPFGPDRAFAIRTEG